MDFSNLTNNLPIRYDIYQREFQHLRRGFYYRLRVAVISYEQTLFAQAGTAMSSAFRLYLY